MRLKAQLQVGPCKLYPGRLESAWFQRLNHMREKLAVNLNLVSEVFLRH